MTIYLLLPHAYYNYLIFHKSGHSVVLTFSSFRSCSRKTIYSKCHFVRIARSTIICIYYITPNLGLAIAVFVLGREHGRFRERRGSIEGATGSREQRGKIHFGLLMDQWMINGILVSKRELILSDSCISLLKQRVQTVQQSLETRPISNMQGSLAPSMAMLLSLLEQLTWD